MKKTLFNFFPTVSAVLIATASWAGDKPPVTPVPGNTEVTTPTPQPPSPESSIFTQKPPTPEPVKLDKQGAPLLVVEFETDRWEILPAFNPNLNAFADYLKNHSDTRAEISAHADNSGHGPANSTLSQKRANAVFAYLVNTGISADRIKAEGYGAVLDKSSNSTAAAKQSARRAFGVIKRS